MSDKKNLYKRSIIKQFYFSQSLSCADLCDAMNKSLPLITKLVNELIEEGKVIETGFKAYIVGRLPPVDGA